ncbi:MAG: NrpR regulatory domain-containing protein [Syntrophales bacterium]|jgi:repressor of nif and glnA expression|nr:NrpR regulatory domain-containing protein [Syntrophales bacterium]
MTTIFNQEDIERKILLILRILQETGEPTGSRLIARRMKDYGVALSERTVRYHLKIMDGRGLTRLVGRLDGRVITERGIEEIADGRVRDKIGMSVSRIEVLAFRTTLDPHKKAGLLPMNVTFLPKGRFRDALAAMKPAFRAGICVSELVFTADEGDRLGDLVVPEGCVGFATVCSVVVNGVLLKHGVPMDSKFGGILQVKDGKALRFVELIYYSGSSLDPSEVFIMAKMSSVRTAAEQGEGKVLANFREIPTVSRELVDQIITNLRLIGIGGVLSLGELSEPICQVPVDVNKLGMILYGGLNPVCCAHEAGIETLNRAMSTILDYDALRPFEEVLREATGRKK